MLKIAVCDDEERQLSIICREIKAAFLTLGEETDVIPYTSGHRLREDLYSGTHYQILFLDISMPDMNGILLAKQLRNYAPEILLLFLSSQEDSVFESIKVSPFRFIRKRTFRSEIREAARDILELSRQKPEDTLILSDKSGMVSIRPMELIYAEAFRKGSILHTVTGKQEIKISFTQLKTELNDYGFLQIHRSILVNYRYIRVIRGTEILLDDATVLPLSRHRITEVKKEFHRLLQS